MSVPEVDTILEEVKREIESQLIATGSDFALLPLVVVAEVLQESTVWQCKYNDRIIVNTPADNISHPYLVPPTISRSLRSLIARNKSNNV